MFRPAGCRALIVIALALAWLAAACGERAGDRGAAQAKTGVVHVRVEGPLDVGTQSLLSRGVRAAKDGDVPLVIELDTPGGDIERMWQLANLIDDASRDGVFTVAWINDRALSAGALVAIACERIYMNPHGVIGAAAVVQLGPSGIQEIVDDTVREKVTSATRSSFRAFAEKKKRPPALAEAMVDRDVEVRVVREHGETKLITGSEWDDARERGETPELVETIVPRGKLLSLSAEQALSHNLIDGIADSLPQVLDKVGYAGATPATLVRARSESLAALLDALKMILLVAGIFAAYWEFKLPGFGVPGVVSIVCFVLFLFGQYLVGVADFIEIAVVAVGLVLIAVEIFMLPGTLWPGLVGVLMVMGGVFAMALGPGFQWGYALSRQYLLDELFTLTLALLGGAIGAYALSNVLRKTPIGRRMVLEPVAGEHFGGAVEEAGRANAAAGEIGVARTALRPVGKIALDATPSVEHEARAEGLAIDRGARVRVLAVQGGRLIVEAVDAAAAGGPGARA